MKSSNWILNFSGVFIRTVCILLLPAISPVMAQADLFIRDTPADEGTEPGMDPGPVWISDDIRITAEPDVNWKPYPFTGIPPWELPPHENAVYSDPSRFSKPNWVYVTVTNRGNQPSGGTEVLKLYWSKAATTLEWPWMWNDFETTPAGCSAAVFFAEEITKPRRNAALLSGEERDEFIAAILEMDQRFFNEDSVSWWDKQDQIHQASHVHNQPSFLPWHRELVNRFEGMLRTINPKLRVPYWDWTTDPRNSINGFDFFTEEFMGRPEGRAGLPFENLDAQEICADARRDFIVTSVPCTTLNCGEKDFLNFTHPPLIIERHLLSGVPLLVPDEQIITSADAEEASQQWFYFRAGKAVSGNPDNLEDQHTAAHAYIGGNIGCTHNSFEDPFVFLIHSNADRIWSQWQRQPGYPWRLDPEEVYGNETLHFDILEPLHPWNGSADFAPVAPWTNPGSDDILEKNSADRSVVNPPLYDAAGLTIPVLQPGESVILQMPWYPPNPQDYDCFGGDLSGFSILARIETETEAPYGFSFPEGGELLQNVKNNNNAAWKQVSVLNALPGTAPVSCISIRHSPGMPASGLLRFSMGEDASGKTLADYASVTVELGATLFESWVENGRQGSGIMESGNASVELTAAGSWLNGLSWQDDEMQTICITINQDVVLPPLVNQEFFLDVEQEIQKSTVGGGRFAVVLLDSSGLTGGTAETGMADHYGFQGYPNPVADAWRIIPPTPDGSFRLALTSLTGIEVAVFSFSGETVLDVSPVPAGFYFAVITGEAPNRPAILPVIKQ